MVARGFRFLLLPLVVGLTVGCPDQGGQSSVPVTITLGDTACDEDKIAVTGTATANRIVPPPGSEYAIEVTVHVKCDGTGVVGVEVEVGYWWGLNETATTNGDGDAVFPRYVRAGSDLPQDPVTVTATINGQEANGDSWEKQESVTVTVDIRGP